MSLTTAIRLIKIDASFNIAGGMSCLKNLYASDFISQATPSSVGLYSTSTVENSSGIIWKNSYNMGLQNTENSRIGLAINVASKNNGFKASIFAGNTNSANPPLYFAYAKLGETLSNIISFYTSNVVVANNIQCSGGMGVSGDMNVGGSLYFTDTITKSTPLVVKDGLNEGSIQQISTELTLSSTGNKVAIANDNQLVFKNATSDIYQPSAYTGRNTIDNVYTNSYITNRVILKQTANITTITSTSSSGIAQIFTRLHFSCIGTLYKGQVIKGAFYYVSIPFGSLNATVGLYSSSSGELLASSGTISYNGDGWRYISFSPQYTITNTEVYYLCILSSFNQIYSIFCYYFDSDYCNYGYAPGNETTKLDRIALYSWQSNFSPPLPSNINGTRLVTNNRVLICGVWS